MPRPLPKPLFSSRDYCNLCASVEHRQLRDRGGGGVEERETGGGGATQSMNVGSDCGTSRPPFSGFHGF